MSQTSEIKVGDAAGAVPAAFGAPVASREVRDPAGGGALLLVDYQVEPGGFEFSMADGRTVRTRAVTLVVKGGRIERIVPNPNNPAGGAASTQKGVPGVAVAARVAR